MTRLTRTTAPRPGRRAVVPVAALSAGLLLGGCSFTSRDLTLEPYAPSDGLQVTLGEVLVRNALVVSEGDGAPGVLSAALVNRGDDDVTILLEVAGTVAEVEVATDETVFLGPSDDEDVVVVIDSVDVVAGGVVELRITEPATDSATLEVPVLLPEGAYAEITPPPSPGAEPTGEPTGEPGFEPSLDPGTEAPTLVDPTFEPSVDPGTEAPTLVEP